MDFDARHRRIDRGGFQVEQAGRRRSDQHQPARHAVRRDAPLDHVNRRNKAIVIVRSKVNPQPAVAVGGHFQPGHGHAFDACFVHPDQNCSGARDHPQHFEAQRGHDVALRHHDHRHPPHDAVALGGDAEKPAPGGRALKGRYVLQQSRELEQKRCRISSDRSHAGSRTLRVGLRDRDGQAGLADHDLRLAHRVGHHLIVAWQRPELASGRLVEVAEGVRRELRRQPVGFGKNHVEGDDQSAHIGEARDHFGDARSRPRPLAQRPQAFLVDIDDDDRSFGGFARLDDLKNIESAQTEFFERGWIGDTQSHQADQQSRAQCACGAKFPHPTYKPIHDSLTKRAPPATEFPVISLGTFA